jgi:hypothetical protein
MHKQKIKETKQRKNLDYRSDEAFPQTAWVFFPQTAWVFPVNRHEILCLFAHGTGTRAARFEYKTNLLTKNQKQLIKS